VLPIRLIRGHVGATCDKKHTKERHEVKGVSIVEKEEKREKRNPYATTPFRRIKTGKNQTGRLIMAYLSQ